MNRNGGGGEGDGFGALHDLQVKISHFPTWKHYIVLIVTRATNLEDCQGRSWEISFQVYCRVRLERLKRQ